MFEIGFTELVLCFVVALVVLGPEKLPAVARALGRWTGQARAYVRELNAQLERETGAGSLKRDLADAAKTVRDSAGAAREEVRRIGDGGGDKPGGTA